MRRLLLVTACDGQVGREFGRPGPSGAPMMRPTRANKPNGYLLGSYRIATAPRAELQPAHEPQVDTLR